MMFLNACEKTFRVALHDEIYIFAAIVVAVVAVVVAVCCFC